ncbi:hypothetical protein CAP35_14840 [Chitinophagaceae bacterium IBVUCB1]|nr:hypothetical protein CAP35_14840 [Chitinophagaceae bacterium IBVUCB1]
MEWYTHEVEKILLAALLGMIIGLEREWSGKAAGFRTLMLVSVGSALFTIVSKHMAEPGMASGDRIASNIVTGIGFLGAGLIFRSEKGVRGLTTAATVWAAAAIGMAVGDGEYYIAVSATVLVWLILVVFYRIQLKFDAMMVTREYHITYDGSTENVLHYYDFFEVRQHNVLENKQIKTTNGLRYIWTIRAPKKKHDAAIQLLLHNARVIELDY